MMSIMELERIEHEEARKASEGTKYDWTELVDFESLHDLKRELRSADELQCREAFKQYFENLIIELDYYDEDDSGHGK